MNRYKENRDFLKANFEVLDYIKTDNQKGLHSIPLQKEYDKNAELIDLPMVNKNVIKKSDIFDCLNDRRSIRKYSEESLSLEELSFLLWATQGIHKVIGNGPASLRTVPSGGASHTFETYLFINRVDTLSKGVYRYLPIEHKLIFIDKLEKMEDKVNLATPRQPFAPNFASKGAVIFAWSCIPYRAEWKFDVTAHKKILIDVGHLCQNLYIACEAIKSGTCAIGIYDQKLVDEMLGLDGENEFVIYMASVGSL